MVLLCFVHATEYKLKQLRLSYTKSRFKIILRGYYQVAPEKSQNIKLAGQLKTTSTKEKSFAADQHEFKATLTLLGYLSQEKEVE